LGKVHVRAERGFDGDEVRPESVCGQLNPLGYSTGYITDKDIGMGRVPLADEKRRDEFSIGVEGNEDILISGLGTVPRPDVPLGF
jgi:hypothetical protein